MRYLAIAMTLLSALFLSLEAKDLSLDVIKKAYSESYKNEALSKYTEAIRDLNEVHATYPETYTVNYRLGWLYYLNSNFANATEHLEKSLRYYPSSVEAMNVLNLILAARAEWKKVENQSSKVIQIDYYNYYANYWLGIAYKNQGKYELAIKNCRKMLATLPSNVTFLAELAANLYLSGEMSESKAIFDNVTVLDPNNETAKYFLKLYKK